MDVDDAHSSGPTLFGLTAGTAAARLERLFRDGTVKWRVLGTGIAGLRSEAFGAYTRDEMKNWVQQAFVQGAAAEMTERMLSQRLCGLEAAAGRGHKKPDSQFYMQLRDLLELMEECDYSPVTLATLSPPSAAGSDDAEAAAAAAGSSALHDDMLFDADQPEDAEWLKMAEAAATATAAATSVFRGCRFSLLPLAGSPNKHKQTITSLIEKHGGTISTEALTALITSSSGSCNGSTSSSTKAYAVCPHGLASEAHAEYGGINCVTIYWLQQCVERGELLRLDQAGAAPAYTPLPFVLPLPAFSTIIVAVSAYEAAPMRLIHKTLQLLGATYIEGINATCTHLMVPSGIGTGFRVLPLVQKALVLGLRPKVVSETWLWESVQQGSPVPAVRKLA